MARYKWATAHEWLLEKAQQHAAKDESAELLSIINTVVPRMDADTIQDDFQTEMAEDGFFEDLDSPEGQENDGG